MVGGRTALTGGAGPSPPEGDRPGAETVALLALRLLPGVGDLIAGRLLLQAPSRAEALEWVRSGRGMAPRAAREALLGDHPRVVREAEQLARRAGDAGIRIIGIDEPGYPARLRRLHDPPAILFLRGRLELLGRPSVAIVGSRRSTPAGRRVAERMARGLAEAGWTVVSGLAVGIDAAAHRGAVGEEGGTVAVLGRGPDRAYPLVHADLFHRMAREGLLASEFPPGVPAQPHNFPRRNRVLAALSSAVVVVEAEERSGALITVDHAIDLGIEVMAVPGSVESPSTRGSNRLLADGATLVTSADGVLRILQGSEAATPGPSPSPSRGSRVSAPPLLPGIDSGEDAPWAEEQDRVLGFLSLEPLPLDLLLERSGLPPSRVLSALTRLDVAGKARRDPDGWIALPGPTAVLPPGAGRSR
ncbi:MAG: DNA-protecting protein DprA [Gemmatimonadales bacterium]|nr:MAG: DNA-protecting protein DprA [Gemmatimonadales bacterium]